MLTAAARRATLVLDGEIIALSGPRPDFTALQRRMGAGRPFTGPLPAAITRHARWAQPVITAEVAYLERTPFGRLRHPVWCGIRPG
jgi:ATP-dependent DNA ligase